MDCKEIWIDDIVELSVYKSKPSPFPIPSVIPSIEKMENITLPAPVISFAYGENDNSIMADDGSIGGKVSGNRTASGFIYTFTFSANVSGHNTDITNIESLISQKDCFVVLKNKAGQLSLCYSLDGTFKFNNNLSTGNSTQNAISISLKSYSNLIQLSLVD